MHAQDPVEAPAIQPRPPARIERRNHLMREAIRDHQHTLKGTQRRASSDVTTENGEATLTDVRR
jgi:hypothetical protein